MVGLCDCNNFFVSCERVFNPSLNGRPVIVLSSNDGCVIARSNESKALGIKMGQPFFQIKQLVASHKVAIHSSNHELYGDMSQRVMETLRQNLPSIEVYSIDEAFLDVESIAIDNLKSFGEELSKRVKRNTGIPVSIGLAPTKTLAKIASKLCKQYPKLNGACLLHRPEDIEKVLCKLPIEDVWGIGRKSSSMLRTYGITTAQQFRSAPEEWIRARMGITGVRTYRELRGEPYILFDQAPSDRKSIMVSRSFAIEADQIDQLHESIASFVAKAAAKLRQQQSVAAQMQLFIATNRHHESAPQHNESRLIQFATPTDSTLELAAAAAELLKTLFKEGYSYKKAGVVLYDLRDNDGVQSSMFDKIDRTKHKSLMTTLDTLNNHYGKESVKLGSQKQSGAKELTNSDYLSKRYTTKWSDILKVKI